MPNRREVLIGLGAVIPAVGLPMAGAARRRRCRVLRGAGDLCSSCNGQGNCDSHNCDGGVCRPQGNPCEAFRRKPVFACAGQTAVCCRGIS